MSQTDEALQRLVGLPLWASGRVADLQWFQFGERRLAAGYNGDVREVGEFALHVQCPWRIRRANAILVGSDDLYYPATEGQTDDFDWTVPGGTRRDRLVDDLFASDVGVLFTVERVRLDGDGTLRLDLNGGFALEVFPVSAPLDADTEYWRLLQPGDDSPHVVVPDLSDLPS